MIIHVVQKGDTLETIANQYNIPVSRIELDNNIPPNNTLSVGQAVMIVPPAQTYTVSEGDTLTSIAKAFGTTILNLLRNNPQLAVKNTLNPGEELVISYNQEEKIHVIGFCTVFITEQVLKRALPYLTYLFIFNYRIDALGNIFDVDDENVINLAYEYGVGPVMFVSAMTESGRGSFAITHAVLSNQDVQNQSIENMLLILRANRFVGANLAFFSIIQEDLPAYVDYVSRVTKRLNSEGYITFVTLTPQTMGYQSGVPYEHTYYADLGKAANKVVLITYQWAQGTIPLVSQTTYNFLKELLDYAVTQIPPEKIFLGLTRIGYDWELPYVDAESLGYSLTTEGALNLANQLGLEIGFDVTTQTPYYLYYTSGVNHFVWFKDVRTVDAILSLVDQYGLYGIAVWNIMYYFPQTWLPINSQFKIVEYKNVPPVE